VINKIFQLDKPIFAVATPKITNTAIQTIVPEMKTERLLFPNTLAYNQKIKTTIAERMVSQIPQIKIEHYRLIRH